MRPQVTQHMADLLDIDVPEFLILTQSHTLPWLVLWKQKDVIQRIVRAREDDDAWLACIEGTNMAQILALLLVQPVPNLDTFVVSLLKGISRRFEEHQLDLTDLLKSEPSITAHHLLTAAATADSDRKSRVCISFLYYDP